MIRGNTTRTPKRPLSLRKTVGVMGPSGQLTKEQREDAYTVGQTIARMGHVLITGGLGGVMEVAAAGAKSAGGFVVGICPTSDKGHVNDYVDVAVMTAMGGGRNFMNIISSEAVVAIGCNKSAGTLSEIAFALQNAVPLMIIRPPAAMRAFLETFEAPGRAKFGDNALNAEHFLEIALAH